ncbi:hypothetical protein [Flavobacterium ginsenosidimutans]|uniref:hypothetical protein n=1 Tax=Flavobacterium ginsenosidimutans TaxID=687844 RepID=UPI001EF6617D|nr:hypothetical protein [Flavobacterium ginsenosidimutans]
MLKKHDETAWLDQSVKIQEFVYPYEGNLIFEPDNPYSDHIVAAQEHVKKFIKDSISNTPGISADEIATQYEQMREQVFIILLLEIEKYIEEMVTVDVKWPDSIRLIEDVSGEFRYFNPDTGSHSLLQKPNDSNTEEKKDL